MQKRKKALQGLKVVDFSWVFTGPIVTKYLGDHGAEIIKIESATRPDGTRLMTPFAPGAMGLNSSGVFANYNSRPTITPASTASTLTCVSRGEKR
jgi:benzylsuccinate CoA-transferase BbsF subunit